MEWDKGKNLTYDQEKIGTYGSDKHQEKYAAFRQWSPHSIAELNGQQVLWPRFRRICVART